MDKRLRNAVIAGAVIMSLVLAVVVFVPRRAEAEDPAEPRLISVNGEATVVVKPDLVTVSFGVETNILNAKEAYRLTPAMNKVIAALRTEALGPTTFRPQLQPPPCLRVGRRAAQHHPVVTAIAATTL